MWIGAAAAVTLLFSSTTPSSEGCPATSAAAEHLVREIASKAPSSKGTGGNIVYEPIALPMLGGVATTAMPPRIGVRGLPSYFWQIHFKLSGDVTEHQPAFLAAHPSRDSFISTCKAGSCSWLASDMRLGLRLAKPGHLYWALLGSDPNDGKPLLMCRYRGPE